MVLSERLPTQQALTAVDGWGGDSYAAYERDGVSCVTVNYRGDTPEDLAQMQRAVQAWVGQGAAGGRRALERQDLTLVFRSCDPGKKAPKVASGKADATALSLALDRISRSSWSRAGMAITVARCGADRLVREFTPAQLNDPQIDKDQVARPIGPCREAA